MKKFVLYLIFVILGVIGVDIVFSFVSEKTISKGTIFSLMGKNELSSDITIIGASRAIHHYDPQYLSDRLNCKVQVLGRAGKSILFHYATFKALLNKTTTITKPRIVLLELAEVDINSKPQESNADELNNLYPFFFSENAVREVLSDVLEKNEVFIIKNSGLYRNNSNLIPYLKPFIKGEPSSIILGYLPLKNVWKDPIKEKIEKGIIDSVKVNYLKKFIIMCKNEEIELIFIMSPTYRILRGENWKEIVKKIANKSNIPVLDFEQDSIFLAHKEWFYDSYHLNEVGVKVYSNLVVDKLIQLYRVKQ